MCMMEFRFSYFVSVIVIFIVISCEEVQSDDNELARIVGDLQSQVMALQDARTYDQATIRNLQEKLLRHFDDSSHTEIEANDLEVTEVPTSDTVFARLLPSSASGVTVQDDEQAILQRDLKLENRALRALQKESHSLNHLDTQLKELKQDLSEVVKIKERDIIATEDIAEFRLEAESLRDELYKIKREVEEVRAKRQEDALAARQARSSQVTTQWLQKTVENIRHEMNELASSVNVSVSLGQKQSQEAGLTLLRSDVSDLRKRMDSVHVAQERDAAWVHQMRLDIAELRSKFQEMASGHQKLVHEIAEVKETISDRDVLWAQQQHAIKAKREITDGHRRRRHGHWGAEIEDLQDLVHNLESHQNSLRQDLRNLRNDQTDMNSKVQTLEVVSTSLVNRTVHFGVEQAAVNRQLDTVLREVDQAEQTANDLRSTVNNITETGIKKLHASTVQLFETLEALENNYDKTVGDVRKEMSKMEFNLAQAQSTLTELQEEQTNYEHGLKSLRNDMKRVQMESRRDRLRVLSLKSDVINMTLQDSKSLNMDAFKEMKISDLETKIATLSKAIDGEKVEVNELHKLIAEKADSVDLSRWERTQDRLREIVLNVTGIIPRVTKEEEQLQKEMEKLVGQLPKDCSFQHMPQLDRKSGTYLIQSPSSSSSSPEQIRSIRVFCDMDTSGGQWTVLQRRKDGRQNFNQNWSQYKEGFGNVEGDFWIGNELMHRLTANEDYTLRIDLWDAAGRYKYAEYETFRVLQENDGYRLAVAGYSGNASDALGYHNGMAFSTPDRDNDASLATHCGQFYGSGWWYNHCQYVNINGRYSTGVTWYDIDGQEWSELTRVEMKIKLTKLIKYKQTTL